MTARKKMQLLQARLREYGRVAIAFSGGVDSAFLLKAAADTLGRDQVLAVTARAANFPERENREATDFAAGLGVRHLQHDVDILSLPEFVENSPERCYHCKKDLFLALWEQVRQNGFAVLADGANTDDDDDFRPGARAVRELGVVSPLRDAGMSKDDIRDLSWELGIAAWDKPSFACLASRIPYGQTITRELLERIAAAERYFFDHGFKNIRVRVHGDLARIEVNPADRDLFFDIDVMNRADAALRALGFAYSALDLRGYRTGSMNETL